MNAGKKTRKHVKEPAKYTELRRQAQDALRESERRFRTLTTSAPVGIFQADVQGNGIYVNEAICSFTGLPAEEHLGKGWATAIHPDDRDRVYKLWTDAVAGQASFNTEFRFLGKAGNVAWVASQAAALRDEAGAVTGFIGTLTDITERRQAEEVLRESERRLKRFYESDIAGFARTRVSDGKLLAVNDYMVKLLGYVDMETCLAEYVGSEHYVDRDARLEMLTQLREAGYARNIELAVTRRDGSAIWVSYSAVVYPDEEYIEFVVLDITERKKAEEALRQSEEKLREFAELLPQTVAETDEKGNILFVNRNAFGVFGYTRDDLEKGLNCLDMLVPEDRNRARQNMRKVLEGEAPGPNEYMALKKDGTTLPVLVYSSAIMRDNKPCGLRAIITDITDRKRMEGANLEYQAKLKAMASQLSRVQELERRSLAGRLHDGVSQKLSMTRAKLQQCAQSATDAHLAETLDGIATDIHKIIDDSYSLMLELSNPILYELGFVPAIRALLESRLLEDQQVKCVLMVTEEHLDFDRDTHIVLYQGVRELLVNAAKHAKAKKVAVCVLKERDCLSIAVKDDGIGFKASDLKLPGTDGGFGLFHLRESLEGIGAEVDIESKLNAGTVVRITVPIDSDKSQ